MDDLVKQARKALDGVTPGPWSWETEGGEWPEDALVGGNGDSVIWWHFGRGFRFKSKACAHFIAAARNLVPAMADRIEALTAERDAAEAKLAQAVEVVTGIIDALDLVDIEAERAAQPGANAWSSAPAVSLLHKRRETRAFLATIQPEGEADDKA